MQKGAYLVVAELVVVRVKGAELVDREESCLDQGHSGLLVRWGILHRILQEWLRRIEVALQ